MTGPSIGIIHTSPATVDLFGKLLKEALPSVRIINILDDSILPELRDNGADIDAVLPRWRNYARVARDQGVDLVLNACSSVGEIGEIVEREEHIPIVRVDVEMAREAVRRGSRISVVATLPTTLRPTSDLVLSTGREAGATVDITSVLVEGAYEALMRADPGEHDRRVLEAVAREASQSDVVVLAQASMARAIPHLPAANQGKVLASPRYAVADVLQRLSRMTGGGAAHGSGGGGTASEGAA